MEVSYNFFQPDMAANELRIRLASGKPVEPDSETATALDEYSKRARWITNYLNCVFHEPHIVRGILRELTLYPVHDTVFLAPPFFCAIGINLHIGHEVQIAQSCHLQDIGIVQLDDGCIIDEGVAILTSTRDPHAARRDELRPNPVRLKHDVWIGARTTILPGVTIGARSVVLPGSVVMSDIPPGTVAGGAPAQYLRDI